MRTYRCNRKQERNFISTALAQCGCTILEEPPWDVAPFVYRVRTPAEETLRIVCYAFRATKFKNTGKGGQRPDDEHRFQIKYGSSFSEYHHIYMPENDREVTLFFGIHFEESVIVAVDPAMHNPTWFSKSVEFKDSHIASIHAESWVGWERDRVAQGRRKQKHELNGLSYQSEAVLGLTPDRFLDYILLERLTTAAPPGERLRATDRWFRDSRLRGAGQSAEAERAARHVLETEFGLSARQILDLLDEHARLRTAVRGSVAEKHLFEQLQAIPDLSVEWLDEDGRPDFFVAYDGFEDFIECKNTSARTYKDGRMKVDLQRTRAPKNNHCGRYYEPSEFGILAACTHAVTGAWDFKFAPTTFLPERPDCPGRIDCNIRVGGEYWTDRVTDLLRS